LGYYLVDLFEEGDVSMVKCESSDSLGVLCFKDSGNDNFLNSES